jgi:hypothetical protein
MVFKHDGLSSQEPLEKETDQQCWQATVCAKGVRERCAGKVCAKGVRERCARKVCAKGVRERCARKVCAKGVRD